MVKYQIPIVHQLKLRHLCTNNLAQRNSPFAGPDQGINYEPFPQNSAILSKVIVFPSRCALLCCRSLVVHHFHIEIEYSSYVEAFWLKPKIQAPSPTDRLGLRLL